MNHCAECGKPISQERFLCPRCEDLLSWDKVRDDEEEDKSAEARSVPPYGGKLKENVLSEAISSCKGEMVVGFPKGEYATA